MKLDAFMANYMEFLVCFSENQVCGDVVWIVGDNFAARSYRTHCKKATNKDLYIKDNFEYIPFINSRYSSSNSNMLAHIQNTFVSAFNQTKDKLLPKYIVMVFDDDLITYLGFKRGDGVATLLGSWVEWLVKEFNEAIAKRLEQLEHRFKKNKIFLYWVTAPTHKCF